jgi:hypothetical protein
MNEHKIPEAAVEAGLYAWGFSSQTRDEYRQLLVHILEAAAPHLEPTIRPRDIYRIQAEAVREAFREFPLETIHAPDNAAVWLSRRADELDRKAERA